MGAVISQVVVSLVDSEVRVPLADKGIQLLVENRAADLQ